MVVGLVVEKKLGTLLLHKTTIILRKGRGSRRREPLVS